MVTHATPQAADHLQQIKSAWPAPLLRSTGAQVPICDMVR